MPLTNDKSALLSKIAGLRPSGWTAGHLGLAWGWYMISPRWHRIWPAESEPQNPSRKLIKAVLLMTDGEFNTSYIPGAGWNSTSVGVENSSPEQTMRLCARMKAEDIVIYTVAFQAPPAAGALLRDCASSERHYFVATTGADLVNSFRTISERLSALRVAR